MSYKLYAANSKNGPYNLQATITNVTQTSYLHSGALSSNPTWFYYLEADFNCPGASVLQSDTIQNETNPQRPILNYVDVNPDGSTTIHWLPSPSPQTDFYIIYASLPNGSTQVIDTVFGRFTNSYTDVFQNANTQSLGYTISAVDSCGNPPSSTVLPHQTVFLQYKTSTCERNLKFTWSKYINYQQGVKEYQVFVDKNQGAGMIKVATTDSNTLSYNYTDFNNNDSLCVVVIAVSNADTTILAHSNYLCFTATIVQPPSFSYITNLTVNLDNSVGITWIVDSIAALLSHDIANSSDCSTFNSVKLLPVLQPLQRFDSFRDSTAETTINSYCYKVSAIDSCSGRKVSPPGKTIFLDGELTDYYQISLTWNEFELYGATVLQYNLYRDYGNGLQLIKTFAPGTTSFADSLQSFLSEKGRFCYRIEAVYTITLPDANYTATLSSFSNLNCIEHRPIIYIPNAFIPGGVTPVFKPRIIFGDPANYHLYIFNRYGGKIFESTEPTLGWDGTDHGKEVQQGGYAYLIQFTASDGVNIERKGIVILVRN